MANAFRPWVLHEANYRQLLDDRPSLALLPWGATEAHNYHLPHGTDVVEASEIAIAAAGKAWEAGARPIVLPAIPFGSNAQQQDQAATIHFSTTTASAILQDIAQSLVAQNIRRLILVNGHGGNDFKPLIRDVMGKFDLFVVLVDFFRLVPNEMAEIFQQPGDHAGDLETSLLLQLRPDWVKLDQAGPGETRPFSQPALKQTGVWTPRPWSKIHPDTGCGDPSTATAEKGARYFNAVVDALATLIIQVDKAEDDALP